MPFAGIHWTKDIVPGCAKMLVGEHTKKNGNADDFSKKRENELVQLVGDLFPAFHPFYAANSTHVKPMGYTLARRGSVYVVPNTGADKPECLTFQEPQWANYMFMVQQALNRGVIRNDNMHEVIEQVLLVKYTGYPGTYYRIDPEVKERLYVGMARDIAKRNSGHLNSPLFLAHVIATENETVARMIESRLIGYAMEQRATRLRQRAGSLLTFPKGVNAFTEMMKVDPLCQDLLRCKTKLIIGE